DKQVYTTQLQVTADLRSKHSAEDRKAQFDLAMKLYKQLSEMSFTVDRINNARLALESRAAQLSADDPLRKQLQTAAVQVDEQRKKIVATKEGGAITGEERLREFLADLYNNVISYEGRPSQTQVDRTASLARELADIVRDFDAWEAKELSGLNSALAKRGLEEIKPLTREEWEKKTEGK
ncbi:MAG: sialidase, partial [Blastocatellia bacterium]|nr:sialidase [Blastocatellia bacterium]